MKSKITLNTNTTVLLAACMVGLAGALAVVSPWTHAQDVARTAKAEPPDDKRWQAVAPGRVEAWSGEIKITSPVAGLIGDVLVKAHDKVLAGDPLVRLQDSEIQARLAAAEAQIGLRKRVRNEQNPTARANDRRKAEDAVADAEKAIVDARAALDRAVMERRAGRGSDVNVEAARTALSRAQDRLRQQKTELRRLENDTNTPLPTQVEGQLNIARAELWVAEAAMEKMTVRAPIAGSVLQVNARAGELAAPSASQPLVLIGDVSTLRVRAELDERDLGEIKVGQLVTVRATAFRGREFAGKVSFIAPIVEAGRLNARAQRNQSDVDVVEVFVDLTDPGTLPVGMRVDVYFRPDK